MRVNETGDVLLKSCGRSAAFSHVPPGPFVACEPCLCRRAILAFLAWQAFSCFGSNLARQNKILGMVPNTTLLSKVRWAVIEDYFSEKKTLNSKHWGMLEEKRFWSTKYGSIKYGYRGNSPLYLVSCDGRLRWQLLGNRGSRTWVTGYYFWKNLWKN